jgi:AmpD protein
MHIEDNVGPSDWRMMPNGWVIGIRQEPSPNCDDLMDKDAERLLVIHHISLPPNQYGGEGVRQLFTNQLLIDEHPYYETIAHLRVSAHFFIRRTGEVIQFVSIHQRAWHAGVSCFNGQTACNNFSLGIEMEGNAFEAFETIQYTQLAALVAIIHQTIPLVAVTGHEHIAPGRKNDPGPFFAWPHLQALMQASGLSIPISLTPQT